MGFPRQKYWSVLPFPPPGHLSDPGIEPRVPALQANSLPLSYQGSRYELGQEPNKNQSPGKSEAWFAPTS